MINKIIKYGVNMKDKRYRRLVREFGKIEAERIWKILFE